MSVRCTRPMLYVLAPLLALLVACGESLSSEELLARGRAALEEGRYRAANIDAKAALQKMPRSAAGRRLLGDIAMAQASYADAASEYEKSLSFESDPQVAADYAVALLEAGKYRELLEEALEDRFAGLESNAVVLAALANAEGAAGNPGKASELIAQALSSSEDDPFVRVVEVRHLAGIDGDLEAARVRAEALAEDYPDYAPGYSALGAVAALQSDQATAAAAFARAAEINPLRVRDRLSLVGALMASGDLDAAKAEAADLDKLIPNSPLLNFLQGRIALSAGDRQSGLAELDEVLSVLPNHPGALYFAGLANLEEGNLATAERQLTAFLAESPGHLEASIALGQLYLRNSEPKRAENVAKQVLANVPGSEAATRILAAALGMQGQFAESAKLYGQLVQGPGSDDAATLVQYGSALIRSGDGAGIAQLEKARDIDPANEEARRLLVASQLAKGQSARARSEAESYRAAAPDSAVPLVLLGQVALWEGDENAAKSALDGALAIDATSSEALRGRAALALKEGDPDSARSVFEKALEEQPESLQALLSLAAIDEQQGDRVAMVEKLERAIAVEPAALAPRLLLARQRMSEQRYADVVALLSDIREVHDQSPDLHELLARAFLALGESSLAAASAQKVLKLHPDSPRALRLAAVTEQANGKAARAEQLINRAVELQPDDPEMRRTLVEIYLREKKYDELLEILGAYPEGIREQRDVKLAMGRVELLRGDASAALVLLEEAHAMAEDSASVSLLFSALLHDRQIVEAEAVADGWLDKTPGDSSVLQLYSTYLLASGKDERGAELLERLLATSPESVPVLNNLAWAYRTVNPGRALELVDQALQQAPKNMSVLDTRSMVLMQAGRLEEALEVNDQALKEAPNVPQLYFHRAQILRELSRTEEAVSALKKIQSADFAEKAQAQQLLAELQPQ